MQPNWPTGQKQKLEAKTEKNKVRQYKNYLFWDLLTGKGDKQDLIRKIFQHKNVVSKKILV